MSPDNDPLAGLYEEDDPLAGLYEEDDRSYLEQAKSKRPNLLQDTSFKIGEAMGGMPDWYEPDISDRADRAFQTGVAETGRGIVSGATLGASEWVPGLETQDNASATIGKGLGSILPVSKAIQGVQTAGKGVYAAAQGAKYAPGALTALADITGTGIAGAGYETARELISGRIPSAAEIAKHGAEWAALDGLFKAFGGIDRWLTGLHRRSKAKNIPVWEEVNDTINKMREEGVDFSTPERAHAKALEIIKRPEPQGPKQPQTKSVKTFNEQKTSNRKLGLELQQQVEPLKNDLKNVKVSPEVLKKLNPEEFAEPIPPKKFDAIEIAEQNNNEVIDEALNDFAMRPVSDQEFGRMIQADLESNLQAAKDVYGPAFNMAEEKAAELSQVADNFKKTIVPIINDLNSLETKPSGFQKTIDDAINAFRDAGYRPVINERGQITGVGETGPKQVSQLIKLNRRLKEIIDYDSLDKHVSDRLKPASSALERDIETGLGQNKAAKKAYKEAKELFAETAQKFGRESIRKMRKAESTEKLAKQVLSPTALEDLKNTTSPEQYKQIEREILEQLKNQNAERAYQRYRELRPHMTPEAQMLAEDILDAKQPRTSPTRRDQLRDKIRDTIYDDLTKSSLTGERPDKVLKLWQTKEGQQIIKDELKNNPNKQEILDYLTEQSLSDFVKTVVKPDGAIDFKKFNELMKDSSVVENLRLTGGQDAVDFFRQLESFSKKIDKNIELANKVLEAPGYEKPSSKAALHKRTPSRQGEVLLKQIAENESNKGEIFERRFGKKAQESAEELLPGQVERGKARLKKMAEKDQPVKFLVDRFFDSLGIKAKGLASLLGLGAHFKTAGATFLADQIFKRLVKQKKLRIDLRKAGRQQSLETFISAIQALSEDLDD